MSEMTCISCHNPHISVKETPQKVFNDACVNCHQPANTAQLHCSLEESERMSENQNNCSGCHMPESGSIDIPHITIHDHYIRKPLSEEEKSQIESFVGLKNVTNPKENNPLIMAKAYIRYYEAFQSELRMLDSARIYLKKAKESNAKTEAWVHLHFLENDFNNVLRYGKDLDTAQIKDPWNLYRIGEAYYSKVKYKKAEVYYVQANKRQPYNLDFRNKLGSTYMQQQKIEKASTVLESIVTENDQHIAALSNLGFVRFNQKRFEEARTLYNKSLAINPDYVPALLNTLALFFYEQNKTKCKQLLNRILELEPDNPKALYLQYNNIL